MIKLKDILTEDKYDSKKAMEYFGALQSMLLDLKQQADPRTSDNRDNFKKVHTGLQLLKATPYYKEANKSGVDYIRLVKKIQKLIDDFNTKVNKKLNDAVSDWHKADK